MDFATQYLKFPERNIRSHELGSDSAKCSICQSSENLEIDHEIPRALVGEAGPITYLCKARHESKISDGQEADWTVVAAVFYRPLLVDGSDMTQMPIFRNHLVM